MKRVVLIFICFVVMSCAMGPRDHYRSWQNREDIRKGFFYIGMYRKAFLDEWGTPSKTYAIFSEQFDRVVGGAEGGEKVYYFRKPVPLDVWVYNEQKTLVVFYKAKLVGWRTGDEVIESIYIKPKKDN